MTEEQHPCDEHHEPCAKLQKCKVEVDDRLSKGEGKFDILSDKIDLLLERHDELSVEVAKMSEVITAWNNIKGFVQVIRGISGFVRITAATGLAIGAIWYFMTHGELPK